MQRHTPEGVILACDFCGCDWDMVKPMIEGHQGSILCIDCLAKAIEQAVAMSGAFKCILCLRDFEANQRGWQPTEPGDGANEDAVVCYDCIQQADRAFDKDPETDWDRRIEPNDRWR